MATKRKLGDCKIVFFDKKKCSSKERKLRKASEIIFSQYGILRRIFRYLNSSDLFLATLVNRVWRDAGRFELKLRLPNISTFQWTNQSGLKHRWYNLSGTKTVQFHLENGLTESARKWAELNKISQKTQLQGKQSFNILFATGATYIHYLWKKSLHFVVHEDLQAAQHIHNELMGPKCQTLLLTSLKIIAPFTHQRAAEENNPFSIVENPDVSLIHIRQPPNVDIRPFTWNSQNPLPDLVSDSGDTFYSLIGKLHLAAFRFITGVDPRVESIRAIVVFNVGEMIHIIKQIWMDFGPFPLIGCDSESLCNLITTKKSDTWKNLDKGNKPESQNYTTCTSGFVILGNERIQTASLVLDMEDRTEESIRRKFSTLVKDKLVSRQSCWGIMLSSCMRGYDGDDINYEHVEQRDQLQNLECRLFHEIVGDNFIGAQVEDVIGTNQIMIEARAVTPRRSIEERINISTPEIVTDDYSSVFLAVSYGN